MVNVSGAKLRPGSIEKINALLYKIIGITGSEAKFHELFNEILSSKEQILIAKRVMIFYLIIKDIPQTDIARALKVTTATVSRYAFFLKGRQTPLTKVIKHHLKNEVFLNLLEDIFFTMFLQPGIKRGHWASYWQHEKEKSKQKTSGI